MNIVIIEDEGLAARRLEKMIGEVDPEIGILARLESVEEAVKWFRANACPDLIFLDIHLEDGLGFSIFEQVRVKAPIIFTTAFDEYAIKAFKLRSIDYLLKPITQDDLAAALQKYRDWAAPAVPQVDIRSLMDLIRQPKAYRNRFSVSFGDRIKAVPVEEVAYFYSSEGITFLVCRDRHEYTLDSSLDNLEHELDPLRFFRVNRQYLVSVGSVLQAHVYPKSRLKLELLPPASQEVFVSIDRVVGFKRWLDR